MSSASRKVVGGGNSTDWLLRLRLLLKASPDFGNRLQQLPRVTDPNHAPVTITVTSGARELSDGYVPTVVTVYRYPSDFYNPPLPVRTAHISAVADSPLTELAGWMIENLPQARLQATLASAHGTSRGRMLRGVWKATFTEKLSAIEAAQTAGEVAKRHPAKNDASE
jgi:hypothetical protein